MSAYVGVIHLEVAQQARNAGLEVVMDLCVKIEHARFFGGLSTLGLNTDVISARRLAHAQIALGARCPPARPLRVR